MKEILNCRISLQVQGGPSLGEVQNVKVDAYDKLEVDVPAKVGQTDESIVVGLQLADTSKLSFVLIKSSSYEGISAESHPVAPEGQPVPAAITISLDGPLMLIGQGACKLLGNNLATLTFKNSTDSPANIQMVIGRDVRQS
jgi:hypothetical protein